MQMHPILYFLPENLQRELCGMDQGTLKHVEEIRIRIGRPVEIVMQSETRCLSFVPTVSDRQYIAEKISQHSFYSLEEEMKKGYITIEGGHRIGIAGKVVLENGRVQSVHSISSFAIRKAAELIGCSAPFMHHLYDQKQQRFKHCLLVGPPKSGKTTLLRDMARSISTGSREKGFSMPAKKVAIVDERSEIAACHNGIPQLTFGTKVDVLDRCPKIEGISMMIRSMSPEVMVVDEVGHEKDIEAVMDAMFTGVTLLMTAHAQSVEELMRRPLMDKLIQSELIHFIECSSRGYSLFRGKDEVMYVERVS
ncbi:stage III sporulation protein AA [Jeotgalibacillus soli]|uniref:Stage III sporulation protein AA n=1 Tax=Jeotgalibacillus soli TaxID=889306 RepID=A0A0C2V5V0_9BACL|nr:stage III sporulation protein AA [Jeotgalibacillus soli]KIL44367.1 stage III sporulation protein AA [Jeotgalibacillus soli]